MNIKPHPDYVKSERRWARCRAIVEGDDAVKSCSEITTIVPKLKGQTKTEYSDYVNRATLFNATARTLDGLLGMVFRKPPVITAPTALQPVIDDMTLARDNVCNMAELSERALHDDILVGRVGYLIERPPVNTEGMTQAQVSALNLRPYVAEYKAESIVDWWFDRVNNSAQLVMVRLAEEVEVWTSGIDRDCIQQERRLLLENGMYVQRIFREVKGKPVQFGGDIIPLMNGAPLDFIPFVCDFSVTKPPILDLADVNLSHFYTDVEREHGAHYTAIPTPMFAGFQFAEGEAFQLGASGGYASQDPSATWGYLEFNGAGLTTLKEIKEEKEKHMAVLGARFLQQDSSKQESTDTVRIRRSGETSVLAGLAQKRSRAMTRILQIMAQWMGIDGDISVELNSDFTEAGLTAQDLTAFVAAWQGGAISQQTLFYNLQHGELYENWVTFEDEQSRIEAQQIAPVGM
jgi:Domain of unknown function (DUF4055)